MAANKTTLIVCSVNDPAGTNIRERLLEKYPFEEGKEVYDQNPVYSLDSNITLATSRQGIVFVSDLDSHFTVDRTVFISKHYAESGIPSLTAHFTGNFARADFGGNPGEIAKYSPSLLKNYMLKLTEIIGDLSSTYNIAIEATHHGPTSLNTPVLFVELGSSDPQWRDISGAEKVSEALMYALETRKTFRDCAVCVGGTHYSDKFKRYLLETDYALGPIVPKYALEYFKGDILKQIVEKSDQPVTKALLDKKGLGKYKDDVLKLLSEFGLEVEYA